MKRSLLALTALALCAAASADENITKAQARLQAEGFYLGNPTGNYDSETAAAVTRYQIRHGLAITGKLDAATSKELGISASKTDLPVLSGSWRRLRSGEMEFVEHSKGNRSVKTPPKAVAPGPSVSTPPPPATVSSAASQNSSSSTAVDSEVSDRLRDYVAAFVLAGLDPHIGSELEFFASHVDYFGAPNVPRERIEKDLVRYDRQWPQRRFWLDGDIRVERQTGTSIAFVFPLRYELRNGSKQASGKVMKSLTLLAGGDNEMQIIAVNEKKE